MGERDTRWRKGMGRIRTRELSKERRMGLCVKQGGDEEVQGKGEVRRQREMSTWWRNGWRGRRRVRWMSSRWKEELR